MKNKLKMFIPLHLKTFLVQTYMNTAQGICNHTGKEPTSHRYSI